MLDKDLLKKCKERLITSSIPKSEDTLADNTEALFMTLFNKALKQVWCENKLTVFLAALNVSIDNHNDTMIVKDGLNKHIGFKYLHSLLLDYFRQYMFDVEIFENDKREIFYDISITRENLLMLVKSSKKRK